MILEDILAHKKKQVEEEKRMIPIKKLMEACDLQPIRDFKKALCTDTMAIIGEVKKASPSKGIIVETFNHRQIASIYEEIPVDALSVLTERQFFKGCDEYLTEVKVLVSKPVLRKDFIIDEFQLYHAKAIGADAVLLISSILKGKLKDFYVLAKNLGLACVTEVHTREEAEEALEAGCDIIGINNRNLKTFEVDLKTTEDIRRYIPKGIVTVSESGIKASEDIKYLRSLDIDAVLIGETFMRYINEGRSIIEFIKSSKGLQR
ncbi:indole-3-glycerol phosphate synthase TrpC [Clostridium thermarum]|uniref:indole-3-glycerol phosphate synthase TrpC n=1 Tax=Clostridium thermarum TaxID=1716543 RepID=UPI001122CAB9|nr:indole-3-glycerol phosphate synthase TrpC [Clostridium thermarum]